MYYKSNFPKTVFQFIDVVSHRAISYYLYALTFTHVESMRQIQVHEFKLAHQFNQTNEYELRNLKPHAHAHPCIIPFCHGNANASYYYYLNTFKHPQIHTHTMYTSIHMAIEYIFIRLDFR